MSYLWMRCYSVIGCSVIGCSVDPFFCDPFFCDPFFCGSVLLWIRSSVDPFSSAGAAQRAAL